MNKRQSSLETTILIIELLKRIPKSWWITAQQLKQQLAEIGLDRDIHTIQRHVKSLVESSHFPIDMNGRSKELSLNNCDILNSVSVHPERSRRVTGTIIEAGVHALRQAQDERSSEAPKCVNYSRTIPKRQPDRAGSVSLKKK